MHGAGGLADLKLGHHDKDGIEVLDVAFSDDAVHVPGVPRFSPTLPPDRLAAVGRLGFGRFEKVALRFTEPFWREAGFPHLMVFPRADG